MAPDILSFVRMEGDGRDSHNDDKVGHSLGLSRAVKWLGTAGVVAAAVIFLARRAPSGKPVEP